MITATYIRADKKLNHFPHRWLGVRLFMLLAISASAQNPVTNFTNNNLHNNANISLLVKDLKTDKVLYSYRPESATIPASTMKVVTTATALEILGADYKFKTTLEIDGSLSTDSILDGNLIIYGNGDPTLGSAKLGNVYFLNDWAPLI